MEKGGLLFGVVTWDSSRKNSMEKLELRRAQIQSKIFMIEFDETHFAGIGGYRFDRG